MTQCPSQNTARSWIERVPDSKLSIFWPWRWIPEYNLHSVISLPVSSVVRKLRIKRSMSLRWEGMGEECASWIHKQIKDFWFTGVSFGYLRNSFSLRVFEMSVCGSSVWVPTARPASGKCSANPKPSLLGTERAEKTVGSRRSLRCTYSNNQKFTWHDCTCADYGHATLTAPHLEAKQGWAWLVLGWETT